MTIASQTFQRTRFTWLTYLIIFYFGVVQAIPGPAVPFLREELGLSRTIAGMHSSMFAIGGLIVGFFGDRYADWVGNRIAMWSAGVLAAVGLTFFVTGLHPIITLLGTFFLGLGAAQLAMMVTSTQGDEHKEHRAVAITEGTLFSTSGVVIAPILVGQLEAAGFGWRVAVLVSVCYFIALGFVFWRTPFPESLSKSEPKDGNGNGRLPALFWIYGAVLFMAVAIEWSMMFWTADYLAETVDLSKDLASTLVSAFVGAMLVGRLIGARITPYYKLGRLLLVSIAVIFVGFPLFWLGTAGVIKIVGLCIVGLGVANLFPLLLSACTLSAPTQTNRASARVSVISGSAILIAPQLLGATADATSIQIAYGLILMLAVAAIFVVLYANRRAEAIA